MSEKFETRVLGLLRTVIERMDSMEKKLSARGSLHCDEARLWTPKDVLRIFGLGERQQYNLRKSGALPYVQKHEGGPIGYLPPDVIGYFLGDTMPSR